MKTNPEDRLQRYADAERNSVVNFNAGAIYALERILLIP